MLFMNWGIRLLMAFVSAGVHCVCQYWRHMFLPAAVLRLFSTPPPFPTLVFYSFADSQFILINLKWCPDHSSLQVRDHLSINWEKEY